MPIDNSHISVLLDEAITGLAIKTDGCYIDCTFGRGGHSALILDNLSSKGRLIAIDRNSHTNHDLFESVGLFFIELQILGYGKRVLRNACSRMYTRTGGSIWLLISATLIPNL